MSIAIVLVLLAAVAGSATMAAVLTWMILRMRQGELSSGGGRDLLALQEQMRRLADELDSAQQEIERLRERADFTDRLLGSGEDREG